MKNFFRDVIMRFQNVQNTTNETDRINKEKTDSIMTDINDRSMLRDGNITVEEIDRLLFQYPESTFLLYKKMSLISADMETYHTEIERCYSILKSIPEDTYTTLALAEYYQEVQNNYDKAYELYNKAIELDVDNTNFWAYLHLSGFYSTMDFEGKAQATMIKAYSIFTHNPLIKLRMAELYVNVTSVHKNADEILYEIPERYRFGDWHRAMALYKMYREDFEAAYEHSESYRVIEPDLLDPYLTTLYIMLYENRYREMIEFCDRILIQYPNADELINYKGIAETELGNYTEAEQLFNKAMEIIGLPAKNCLYIHTEMIILYLKMGQIEKARTYFEEYFAEYRTKRYGMVRSLLITYFTSQEDFQKEQRNFIDNYDGTLSWNDVDEMFKRFGLKAFLHISFTDGKYSFYIAERPTDN